MGQVNCSCNQQNEAEEVQDPIQGNILQDPPKDLEEATQRLRQMNHLMENRRRVMLQDLNNVMNWQKKIASAYEIENQIQDIIVTQLTALNDEGNLDEQQRAGTEAVHGAFELIDNFIIQFNALSKQNLNLLDAIEENIFEGRLFQMENYKTELIETKLQKITQLKCEMQNDKELCEQLRIQLQKREMEVEKLESELNRTGLQKEDFFQQT